MMKKLTALLLSVLMLVSLCACTGDGKYCVVKSLDELQYSIVLRNGDSSYHYINAALQELESDGRIDALAQDWFGDSDAVDFPSGNNRVKDFEYIEPREFTIGVDLDSFPMCFEENGVYTGFDVVLAQEVCDKLKALGVRAETDLRNERTGYKIREAQMQKIPYMIVVGEKEKEAGTVAVRTRAGVDMGALAFDDFAAKLTEEIKTRA